MDEIVKSIKAFLYDRTVSPLFGAYVSAWSIWNYQVFIVILDGKADLLTKLNFLNAYFGQVFYIVGNTLFIPGWFYNGILCPVLLTFFYLYIYPKVAKPVYARSLQDQLELRAARQEKEKQKLLSKEESNKLIAEIEQIRLVAEKDSLNYRSRIASLTETINSLEEENAQAKKFTSATDNELNSDNQADTTKEGYRRSSQHVNATESSVPEDTDSDFERSSSVQKSSTQDAISPSDVNTMLIQVYTNGRYAPSKFLSQEAQNEALNRISTYFSRHGINKNMLSILTFLVAIGGYEESNTIKSYFSSIYNPIEIDYLLNKLAGKNLISLSNDHSSVRLSNLGKEYAVESGLTALDTQLKGK